MINLIEAGTIFRAVFMSLLLTEAILNICCIPNIFIREYKLPTKLLTFFFNITGFVLIVILSIGLHDLFFSQPIPAFYLRFLVNAEYSLVYIILNFIFLFVLISGEIRYRKNRVSSLSIKQSFDHLPTGLCFSRANGTVQLVNHKMNELGYILTGEEIQNANSFWKAILNGNVQPGVHKIPDSIHPEYRLENGTVYGFRREIVENIFQITATDITNLHKLTNRLKMNNEELEEMNERLRIYGESVDETTRAKERLETKIRIHSELGQALLATRHCLSQPQADYTPVINAWKRNIAVLRAEAEPVQNTDLLKSLIDIAESAGVRVQISGNFPANDVTAGLFTSAATETLTNAVRHAQATTLFVDFSESENFYCASYTNDGIAPSDLIREGGGLGSLRSKIERYGGEMEIVSLPEFILTVKLPKEVERFV